MLSLRVFGVLYFRIVTVNGHCLLGLADLEISFCNFYGAVQVVFVLFGCILN